MIEADSDYSKKRKIKKKKHKKKEKRHRHNDDLPCRRLDMDDREAKRARKKARKRARKESITEVASHGETAAQADADQHTSPPLRPLVESLAWSTNTAITTSNPQCHKPSDRNTTLLLFYQYVEPPWSSAVYQQAQQDVQRLASACNITGRMRVAREGLNCTLTGRRSSIVQFCHELRGWSSVFDATEFKLTHDLPDGQCFTDLNIIPVRELVHYGLAGSKAPPMAHYAGTHLEPAAYHAKLAEPNTVVIDVRNHYEALIGRFHPNRYRDERSSASTMDDDRDSDTATGSAQYLEPHMRKSTEFPIWLDQPSTQQALQGKQVLMYCTGGIRCERASALLKYKMAHDPNVQQLNIRGVYQLQGGIDKYLKEFPNGGGYWVGKNYTFDKRFAHGAAVEHDGQDQNNGHAILGRCQSCQAAWDRYRGKRRCPTCGVPSLICQTCWHAQQDGTLDLSTIRCELCVEQNVRSKRELKLQAEQQLQEYEARLAAQGLLEPSREQWKGSSRNSAKFTTPGKSAPASNSVPSNPDGVTRLYLKNMCRKHMTTNILLQHLPPDGVTHLVWKHDRQGNFSGQAWLEMANADVAAQAMALSGTVVLGRPLYVEFQPPGGKDLWPPPQSALRNADVER